MAGQHMQKYVTKLSWASLWREIATQWTFEKRKSKSDPSEHETRNKPY